MTIQFNVTGKERKALVKAISEVLNNPVDYLGAPSFNYLIGGYHIDKNGTLTGEDNPGLVSGLAAFPAASIVYDAPLADAGEEPAAAPIEPETAEAVAAATSEAGTEEVETAAGRVTIEVPWEGFTPESFDNLCKLANSKAPLIKKVLGAEDLPIRVVENRIQFPWFPACAAADLAAYTQFVVALCDTAKEKKRVTARPQETYENEKFALRVWMIGLGLKGADYSATRKLMLKNLSGDSSWRYGKPEKATVAAAPEIPPEIDTPEPPADDTPEEDTPETPVTDNPAENAELSGAHTETPAEDSPAEDTAETPEDTPPEEEPTGE